MERITYVTKNVTVRLEPVMAASMKMAVLCIAEPCILVEIYGRFRGTCSLSNMRAMSAR
jgi:hypothetical protein